MFLVSRLPLLIKVKTALVRPASGSTDSSGRLLRLLLLQALERGPDVVVAVGLGLEVGLDERHLLGDGLGDGLERLLDRVLGVVPVELGDVGEAVDVVGHEVLVQLVLLVLEHLAQVGGHLARLLLHERVELVELVGEAEQLVERAHLQVGDVELVRVDDAADALVQLFPGLLGGLVAWH